MFTIKKIYSPNYNEWEKLVNYIKNSLSKKVKIWDILVIEWFIWNKYHYHSVIVKNVDVNNDIIVVENPYTPKENNLIRTLSRAPERHIRYIISETSKLKKIYFNNN